MAAALVILKIPYLPSFSNIYLIFCLLQSRAGQSLQLFFFLHLGTVNKFGKALISSICSKCLPTILQSRFTTCFLKMMIRLKPCIAESTCFSVGKELTITIFLRNRAMHYNTYCESRSLRILNSFSILCFTPYIKYSSHVTGTIIEK